MCLKSVPWMTLVTQPSGEVLPLAVAVLLERGPAGLKGQQLLAHAAKAVVHGGVLSIDQLLVVLLDDEAEVFDLALLRHGLNCWARFKSFFVLLFDQFDLLS